MASLALFRRNNSDGTQASSPPTCQNLITEAPVKLVLEAAESRDTCDIPKLSASVLPRYLTLTERVLVFLEGRNAINCG